MKNPTEFLTPTFGENIKCKVPTEYVKHEEYDRILHRCEQFDQIRQSSHIQQNTSHVKNPTEFLTPIFYQNLSHVRNSTVYVTCEEFDPILYSCETMEK